MVKADLRKADDAWKASIGSAIDRARCLVGWTLKEFAAHVARDERQVARWITGAERVQLDALFAVESLRQPLVQALAELAGGAIEVSTVVTIHRRTA